MVTKIAHNHFVGVSKIHARDADGLTAILRGIAADHALIKLNALTVGDITLTDNSTGVSAGTIPNIVIPDNAIVSASGSDGATLTALNTALGKTENALRVMGTLVNLARAPLGLTALTFGAGTVATPGTIPAQDKTVAGASSTSAAQFASGRAAFVVVKTNFLRLQMAMNEVVNAVGRPDMTTALKGSYVAGVALADIPTVVAAASGGPSTLSKAEADAALTAAAGAIASMATKWNAVTAAMSGTALKVVAG